MNLTNCPACNHQVSDQASQCPSCGQPLKARGKWAAKLIIALLAASLGIWFFVSVWRDVQEGNNGPLNIQVHAK